MIIPSTLAACQDHARPSRAARVGARPTLWQAKQGCGKAGKLLLFKQTYPTTPNRVRLAWHARAKNAHSGVFASKHAPAECETHLWRGPQLLTLPLLEAQDAERGVGAADAGWGTQKSGTPGARLPACASSTCNMVPPTSAVAQ